MSSNFKKTIKINPDLFRSPGTFGGATRKLRDKKPKPANPLIHPNALKKQLLNRIKDYKTKEEIDRKIAGSSSSSTEFTDEFMDSIQYLNSLSKKKKEDEKQLNKTLKNPYAAPNYPVSAMPMIQLELPEELKDFPEVKPKRNVQISTDIQQQSIFLNYDKHAEPAYGCLKNGSKPTFREWQQQATRKNISIPTQQSSIRIEQPIPYASVTEREQRLENIKQKIKMQQDALQNEKQMMTHNLIQPPPVDIIIPTAATLIPTSSNIEPLNYVQTQQMSELEPASIFQPMQTMFTPIQAPLIRENELKEFVDEIRVEPKKMIKRTIKKRYTLGKSSIYRKVGILIKDKNTRKQIIDAHKELKKEPINDIKKYLRNHGLLKVGSNAPVNVIRQIYESSKLSGDITNNNKDTLLHNFLSETEE